MLTDWSFKFWVRQWNSNLFFFFSFFVLRLFLFLLSFFFSFFFHKNKIFLPACWARSMWAWSIWSMWFETRCRHKSDLSSNSSPQLTQCFTAVDPSQTCFPKKKKTRINTIGLQYQIMTDNFINNSSFSAIPNFMGHFYMSWFLTSAYFPVSTTLDYSNIDKDCIFYA